MTSRSALENQAWSASSFVGGSLCLDFANTQGGRDKTRDEERLPSYLAAIGWARSANMVSDDESRLLQAMALQAPVEAADSLQQMRLFRESLTLPANFGSLN
jgi:hypothetical protein